MKNLILPTLGGLLMLAVPAKADMAAAEALIAKHSQLPTFEAPGPAFDAKACMKDKKMFVIPLTNANPFNAAISQGFVDAAAMVGFELRDWETQMDPAGWIQGINTATAEGFDLIDLQGGLPPEFLVPQITEARTAGVKVTATHNWDATTQTVPDFMDGAANTDYVTVGEIIAAWAMVKTGGKVNAIVLGPDEITPTAPLRDAIIGYLKDNCPDCKTQYINVPVNDWATKTQPAVQNALLADPTINYVLPVYDSMSQFIVPAIQIAGSSAKIVSYNGTPFVLDMMRDGDIVEMNVGESLGWVGMAGTDANMRLLCGLDPVTKLNTPAYIFSDENVATAGNPATFNDGYGDVHRAGFAKLWGVE
ncbi:sugar ABC transporter substrate-binding protein [Hoeflea alexandrii]|uniref:Sugar ABC transporter substrate-binding protein n=1 Tax=Hoeflea alexandrii TaxID=288436 RepID=A0ABT1D095_9HYPH|nr:sugar ABC transporter substrate-binding protein [Hoeflea alexandrii]MCO6410991.1 sugar ABC transporter substrate-binding protein [Hoeflea alexandrii]